MKTLTIDLSRYNGEEEVYFILEDEQIHEYETDIDLVKDELTLTFENEELRDFALKILLCNTKIA